MFDEVDIPIPPLRQDLEILPYEDDGKQLLVMRDPAGYGTEMVVFKPEAWALFSLFDGKQTISELQREIFKGTEVHVDADQILDIVKMLDDYYFLQSERFEEHRMIEDEKFLSAELRPAVHAGVSYPETSEELKSLLDDLMESDTSDLPDEAPVAILTPHIDLRIGPNVYVAPFRHLAATNGFDTIVILGTSHYSHEGMFLLSRKHIDTPMGVLQCDTELVDAIHEETGHVFTKSDIAHKQEHSIEFPALFIKHAFDENIKVLPVLVTSFDDSLTSGEPPSSFPNYQTFIDGLRTSLDALNRKALYVLSVDWSHIGLKFGDEEPAETLLPATEESDQKQLAALERGDYKEFRALLVENGNETKIDGYSCITTFFDLVSPSRAHLFEYDRWHEEERQSAVTFAGMSFFK
jgi:MEMO1 family protein